MSTTLDRPATGTEARQQQRRAMVADQIEARRVRDPAVLEAMLEVPREAFLEGRMQEFAYEDSPLPIGAGQTISQPFIVALMAELAELTEDDRVLEVGAGSGYAAAVFSRVAREVHAIERHGELAEAAEARMRELGYDNVRIHHGDGTLGLREHAPFDAIIVSAGGREIPQALRDQLAPGGRIIIPVGPTKDAQRLVRIREREGRLAEENLGDVRFVPLVGAGGWEPEDPGPIQRVQRSRPTPLPELVARGGDPLDPVDDLEDAALDAWLDRVGDARVVLLGEASHGTHEFYALRARLTRALIERAGFTDIAVEADWPDAARVDHHVRDLDRPLGEWTAFARFPQWMWRNTDVLDLVEWLRDHNAALDHDERVGFHGLDLYSLYTSIHEVLRYLDDVDPDTAAVARARYGCLTGFESDPAFYGRAATTGAMDDCEQEVVDMLSDLLNKRVSYLPGDGERFHDAAQNARLVKNAERYYRAMYRGRHTSWNLRDSHMFETLHSLLEHRGEHGRIVVWAHNSHLGDARFTEMSRRGEHNLGQLCRQRLPDPWTYNLGFGTHSGTVAAAHDWGDDMQVMDVRPSHPDSYERVCHDADVPRFLLPLRDNALPEVPRRLAEPRLERAIGVIYRPRTELQSHYFQAILSRQFDEWCWLDETSAVTPLGAEQLQGMPDTFPFGE